jgi:hypothetical protein
MTRTTEENRSRQILVGGLILLVIALSVCGALIGSRYQQGLVGEWVSLMVGIMTTPFFMEASFVILGFTVVISINTWRRSKDGDELVYLEQVKDVDADGLPDHASWAVYSKPPLAGEVPSRLAQAEGALEIGDFEAAGEWIGSMSKEELNHPDCFRLRIALAEATGRSELARQLRIELTALMNRNDT